jgi:hypothetical protein
MDKVVGTCLDVPKMRCQIITFLPQLEGDYFVHGWKMDIWEISDE